MASSLPTTASASASLVTKPGTGPANLPGHGNSLLSFRLSPTPNLRFLAKGMQPSHSFSTLVRAQLNEVTVNRSSNSSASPQTKSEGPSAEVKDPRPSSDPTALATEESISEFITQVASLVKLVDSRDIVELQLKQFDCELLIRKKEALPQPLSPPAPAIMMQSPPPPPLMPVTAPAPPQTVASTPPSSPAPPASPPVASAKSSLPPLKCPMAGTFYRSAAPGEPPFVKVGDKVQKGQVLCIIEAMKLMNEIEADQSGTIVEILVEDGKSVSVDMPLFVIQP